MANLIGATRETVTLGLGHLQLEKRIRVSRRRITVVNRADLASEVHGTGPPRYSGAVRGRAPERDMTQSIEAKVIANT